MKSSSAMVRIQAAGPFRVMTPEGADMTPRGMKACGLLALLLLAPDMSRPRALLQDKLWSDRGPEQGAASLRQTLTEIRRSLGAHKDLLHTTGRLIRLDQSRFTFDLDEIKRGEAPLGDRELLEDINIRDREFEHWIRDQREEFRENLVMATAAASAGPTPEISGLRPPSIRLVARANPPDTPFHSTVLMESIARSVSEWGAVENLSAGGAAAEKLALDEAGSADRAAFIMEASELVRDDKVAVQLRLLDARHGTAYWQSTYAIDVASFFGAKGQDLSRAINEGMDQVIHQLLDHNSMGAVEPRHAALNGFRTISEMLKRRGADYERTRIELERCFEQTNRGIYIAWLAFLTTFSVGERHATDRRDIEMEAKELVRRALELEPHNSIVLALCSHTHSFLLRNYHAAHELAQRSVRLNASNPLGWAFLGIASVYLGNFKQGAKETSIARAICSDGPYRYIVDTLAFIAAVLAGKTDQAVSLGEAVRGIVPNYAPPLRYLTALYAKMGDFSRVEQLVAELRKTEPDFSLRLLGEPNYPVSALQSARYLDFNGMPND